MIKQTGTLNGRVSASGELKGSVKQTASLNGKMSPGQGVGGNPYAVTYVEQELTVEEQAQARENIGAADVEDVEHLAQSFNEIDASFAQKVSKHNVDETSHNDLRVLLTNLREAVSKFLDVDDEKVDQLSEVLAGIDANTDLITALTSSKVNVKDIVNNLETNLDNVPLSAAQGVVLKSLYDVLDAAIKNIKIPTELPASDVYDWAKEEEKPEYTADEVGARPNTWTPSATDVGADPAGTAASKVSEHNTNDAAHNDIRVVLQELKTAFNNFMDMSEEEWNQASEFVAAIKANKATVEELTTNKVSTSDIINNLTTNLSTKVLSAAQGVAMKALIDALQKLFDTHKGDATAHITAAERTAWNAKANKATTLAGYGITDGVTNEEFEQLSEEIADLKFSGIQQTPLFANSIEECTDTTKLYVLPDGFIYAYHEGNNVTPPNTSYETAVGVKIDSSTGNETTGQSAYSASSYIEVVEGYSYTLTRTSGNGKRSVKICYYDADKNFISTSSDVFAQDDNNEESTKDIPLISGASYFRLRMYHTDTDASNIFIVNAIGGVEEAGGWFNTGHAFVPATNELVEALAERIGVPIYGIVEEDNNIKLYGALGTGTYTLKYEMEDGTTLDIGSLTVGASSEPTSGIVDITWSAETKLDKTTGVTASGSGYGASQSIEITDGYTYTATATKLSNGSINTGLSVCYYDANGSYLGYEELWSGDTSEHSAVLTPKTNSATFRLRAYYGSSGVTMLDAFGLTWEKTA